MDVNDFIKERGGDPEKIRESQRKRFANVEIVDEIIRDFEIHRQSTLAVFIFAHVVRNFPFFFPPFSQPCALFD